MITESAPLQLEREETTAADTAASLTCLEVWSRWVLSLPDEGFDECGTESNILRGLD